MIKKSSLFILIFLVMIVLTWCGSSQDLQIRFGALQGTLSLKTQMQSVYIDQGIAYQEVNATTGAILDSLIIFEEETSLSPNAYLLQQLNRLKLSGYQISEELAKKSTLTSQNLFWNLDALNTGTLNSYPTFLKTYKIINTLGSELYIAHYGIDMGGRLLFVSFASESKSARVSFENSLKNLTL